MALMVKNLPANSGDIREVGLIPGSRRPSGGGQSHTLQYSCLKNAIDRRAWQVIVHRVDKICTRLK